MNPMFALTAWAIPLMVWCPWLLPARMLPPFESSAGQPRHAVPACPPSSGSGPRRPHARGLLSALSML